MFKFKNATYTLLLLAVIFNLTGCSDHRTTIPQISEQASEKIEATQETPEQSSERLIVTPEDLHGPIIEVINSAKKTIDLANFHLSDKAVVQALINASTNREVKIRIILDAGTLERSTTAQKIVASLKASNVEVKPSSKFFSISHQKSFVIDGELALISTINLVTTSATTRDFGLFTHDKDMITEINSVFQTDWTNADNNGGETPPLLNERLLWSPINALPKLKDLILSAKQDIKLMVENLGSADISDALILKAKEGITIRVLTPGCTLRNRPYIKTLEDNNIANKVASAVSDAEHPFVHAKMILVDNKTYYLGSENFSYNSLLKARELGVITTDKVNANKITDVFEHDWKNASSTAGVTEEDCKNAQAAPAVKTEPEETAIAN